MTDIKVKYQDQPLYGGAIGTVIPTGFLDASQVRQVPDTQEVFVNLQNSALDKEFSIIFDLLERVGVEGDNEEIDASAVKVHLDEIAQLNGEDTKQLIHTENVSSRIKHFANTATPTTAYVSIAASPAHKWGKPNNDVEDEEGKENKQEKTCKWLILVLGLIRYKETDTDILVTVNLPTTVSAALLDELIRLVTSKSNGKATLGQEKVQHKVETAKEVVLLAVENYIVKDKALFGM